MRTAAVAVLFGVGVLGSRDVTRRTESYMLNGRLEDDDMQWVSEGTAVVVTKGKDFYTTGGTEPGWQWQSASYNADTVCRSKDKCISKAEIWPGGKRYFLHGLWATVVVDPATREATVCVDKEGNPLRFFKMRTHPVAKDRVLGLTFWKNCTYSDDIGCPYQIYLSKDSGRTFELLHPSVGGKPDTWVVDWAPMAGGKYDDKRLLMVRQEVWGARSKGLYRWSYESGPTDTEEQDWTGVQWAPHLRNAVYFVKAANFVFAAVVDGGVQLWVRSPGASNFVRAQFPGGLREKSYTVMDASEGTVFVNVFHQPNPQMCPKCKSSHWGHLYLSDLRGQYYQYSLMYNRRNPGNTPYGGDAGSCDLHKVHGMQGVYVASRIKLEDGKVPQECMYCEHPNNDVGTSCALACKYETVMTWYKGEANSWDLLDPPRQTISGEEIDLCQGSTDCHLHLHGYASGQDYIQAPLSRDDAPGLVIASGNVGKWLDVEGQTVDIFLTKDAGLTWKRLAEGPHAYDWLDYGGFIALAPTQEETNSFKYSADGGLTWDSAQFSSSKVRVRQLRLVGGSSFNDQRRPLLMIETLADVEDTSRTTMYRVNVSDISYYLSDFCQKPDDADLDAPNSNYESFHPRAKYVQKNGGLSTEECFLGVRETFLRKREGAQCWSDLSSTAVEQPRKVLPCPCKREDFECDAGYELDRTGATDNCVAIDPFGPEPAPNQLCDQWWTRTRGYVRVPGDKCDAAGGLEQWDPVRMPCPGGSSGGSGGSKFLKFLLALLIIAGVVYATWWGYNNNPTCAAILDLIRDTVAGAAGAVGAAGAQMNPGRYTAVQNLELDVDDGSDHEEFHADDDDDESGRRGGGSGAPWRGVPNGTEQEAPAPAPAASPPPAEPTPVVAAVLSQAPPAPTTSAVSVAAAPQEEQAPPPQQSSPPAQQEIPVTVATTHSADDFFA
eukprot:Hpha_TRINITY_DN15575_c2_g3::TRINITY_DN15575_c2_g3_i1::g.105643::m.105643